VEAEYQNLKLFQPLFSSHKNVDKNITQLLKLICNLTAEVGYCFAFNEYFMGKVGVSERTVMRYLRKVENEGFIKCTYSHKRAYWRRIYLTEKGEQFWAENNPRKKFDYNTILNINNNNTNEQNADIAMHTAEEIFTNFSVSCFKNEEIAKKDEEIAELELIEDELRIEITEMWKNNGKFDEIMAKESKRGNLQRIIMQQKTDLAGLKRKKFDIFVMQKLVGIPVYVKRLLILCKHKRLNFKQLYFQIVKSIEKGSLSICKKTKQQMHINMGFNIAMKLIRDGKWRCVVC
jgi:DNA-binding PadR family transcriptional regulator